MFMHKSLTQRKAGQAVSMVETQWNQRAVIEEEADCSYIQSHFCILFE